jgi:hypothetical protein
MAETIDDTKTFTIALTAEPGLGEIVSLNYPATVKHGASFDVNASTKNVGSGDGEFVMELYVNGSLESRSAEFGLGAGATSTDKIPAATAPAEGTSMAIAVKCIRIT